MLSKRWLVTAVIVAVACAATGAEAARRSGGAKRPAPRLKTHSGSGIKTLDSDRRIDVNSVNMWVTNYGSIAFDLSTGNGGLVWPKGTTKTAVFASGLWMGALVNGERRMAIAEYGMEYGPGRILSPTTFDNPSDTRLVAYKVVRFSGNPQDTAHVDRTAEEMTADPLADPLVHHSWSEYVNGAKPFGAPTRMFRLPNTATSDPDDSVDVEGPDVLGDQMIWTIYNDLNPDNHQGNTDAGGTDPMGVEVEQKTFGFNRLGPLGNTVFMSYTIRNKGGNTLNNMYASVWSDPDLGGFTDDLVGVDTTRSLGYVYNSSNNDQLYGLQPPSVGYDFFLGPVSAGDTLGLASFNKYINGTDPHSPTETYNYMQGLLPDGSILIDPTTGLPTRFFHPGDPVTRTGWLDAVPADRRFLLTTGPFTMAPGDSQIIVAAIVIAQGVDRTSSVSLLRCFDDVAQLAFDRGFQLPPPPAPPQVSVSADQNQVTLTWDTGSRFGPQAPGYRFEGYNVYQGESVAGPWRRIVTFDEVNRIGQVLELQCDESGSQLEVPTAFGSDAGISYSFTTGDDVVRGGRLKEGTEYYFAVTAYSVDTTQVFPNSQVLENSPSTQVIRVIPQSAAGGTDFSTAAATEMTYVPVDTLQIPTTAHVTVDVVNAFEVTGHQYRIDFIPLPPESVYTRIVAGDTATARVFWRLTDVTDNEVLLDRQFNLRGDTDYEVVDGLLIKVIGSYFPELTEVTYLDLNEDARRRLDASLNWSGNADLYFFGGGGFSSLFEDDETTFASSFGAGTPPDSFRRVVLAFDTAPTQKSYRFLRYEIGDTSTQVGNAPPGGRRFEYGGYVDTRLIATDELTGEQLQTAYLERIFTDSLGTILPDSLQPASLDSTWFPTDDRATLGGREYIWVLNRLYSEDEIPAIAQDGEPVDTGSPWPALFTLTAMARAGVSAPTAWQGDGILFGWAIPPTPNDAFTFNTSQLVQNDVALARSALDRIRVVPNPYYTRSRYELNQFNRVIRFINMPERATVRIYNLAGELVRTLRKDDAGSSVLTWDVLTENQLPVGSGVYIYHVEAPGVGETFGRLVVFMEKERLNNL